MALIIIENTTATTETTLTREEVNKVCRNVIETMKNGLPDEAHSIEVFEYILKETGSVLKNTHVKL